VLTTSAFGSEDDPSEDSSVIVERTPDLQWLRARLHGHDRIDSLFDSDTYSPRPHPLSRILVPEPLIAAWAPFAIRRTRRLARRRPPDCVITTSPPESAHLVGLKLARRGVPWVADLRDGWTFEPLRPRFPTAPQRRLDRRLEQQWLSAANVVTCVSAPVADDLRARGVADPVVVPNGWDPDSIPSDAPGEAPQLDPDRTSLVYTGRFGSYGRDPRGLLAGLRRLAGDEPSLASRLELAIAGPLTEAERDLFSTEVSPAKITLLGSLERPDALALQRSADALLVLASARRSQLANLKLYEYLSAGRPILALAEGTEAGRIAAEAGGAVVRADDPGRISVALARLVRGEIAAPGAESRKRYAYPGVAEQMSDVVELAITRPARRV